MFWTWIGTIAILGFGGRIAFALLESAFDDYSTKGEKNFYSGAAGFVLMVVILLLAWVWS